MVTRRRILQSLGGAAGLALVSPLAVPAGDGLITRAIPSTGERLPALGMGTWMTFNVGDDSDVRASRRAVLQAFFDRGGRLIDSSPMYGHAQEVLGVLLPQVSGSASLFSATKVWIVGRDVGVRQMQEAEGLWGVQRFDLMQIHNLLDWETHIETLKEWKATGRVRYIGATTSHGRRHAEMEQVMLSEPLDSIQVTYNLVDREVEQRLLPLALERGIAVIINRPFRRGDLFEHVQREPLPPWAVEFDCANWAQFFLKFIISHPAVTCAIPATSRADHMHENMGAAYGRLPDAAARQRMIAYFASM